MSEAEGAQAVLLARRAVSGLWGADAVPTRPARLGPVFEEPRGVFATWKTHPDGRLRGCIGYPLPVVPLGKAIEEVAVAAAVDDPRFPAVTAFELPSLCVEVSILTVPVPVRPEDRPGGVQAGRDGLLVSRGRASGLLLPQVAVEEGWTREELLDGTCEKAGLLPGSWRSPEVRVAAFQAEIFGERKPGGPAVRLGLAAASPSAT